MDCSCGTLLGGRVRYAQPVTGFRTGIEPVLLAASIPAKPGSRVLEGGTGAGAGLLCLAARVALGEGVGVEIDPALAALGGRNAAENGFPLRFVADDLLTFRPEAEFDHAFANPPYHDSAGTAPPEPGRAQAKQASPGLMGAWTGALAARLRSGGTLSLVLPPARLPEVITACAACGCGSLRLFPLWPVAGRAAKLLILRATRHGRSPAALFAGLVLHEADGRFTEPAEAVLRGGAALAF